MPEDPALWRTLFVGLAGLAVIPLQYTDPCGVFRPGPLKPIGSFGILVYTLEDAPSLV